MAPIKFNVEFTPSTFKMTLPGDFGLVTLTADLAAPAPANAVRLATQAMALVGVDTVPAKADGLIVLQPAGAIDAAKVKRFFQDWQQGPTPTPAPAIAAYLALLQPLLARLGLHQAQPHKPAKARHRFIKALSTRPFHVEHAGSKATVYWTAAKAMTIKAGAQLKVDPLVNKDGSLSYGSKYGQKLRADHAAAIAGDHTTADVVLRSVNEVGLFLYFGDTNGWLELVDDQGQTLAELTTS